MNWDTSVMVVMQMMMYSAAVPVTDEQHFGYIGGWFVRLFLVIKHPALPSRFASEALQMMVRDIPFHCHLFLDDQIGHLYCLWDISAGFTPLYLISSDKAPSRKPKSFVGNQCPMK